MGRCKLHGGSTPSHAQAAAKEQARAELAQSGMHVSLSIEPQDLLLRAVHLAAGQLAHATLMVEQYSAGGEKPSGALFDVWLERQAAAHEKAARFAEAALRQGVAERRVRLAERQAALIAQAIEEAISDLGLTGIDRARFAQRVEARLMVLEQGGDALGAAGVEAG